MGLPLPTPMDESHFEEHGEGMKFEVVFKIGHRLRFEILRSPGAG